MAGVDDGRRANHPWENLPQVRLCRLCGLVLAPSGPEYTIGIHVWCLHERNKLERKRIRTPTYGTRLQGTDE